MKALIFLVAVVVGMAVQALVTSKGFVRMPNTYEEVYYLSAILAVIVGGAWAVTTWVQQETRRKAREMPGIEMDIQFAEATMPSGKVLLTVDVVVHNTSDFPIRPLINDMVLSIGKLAVPESIGFIAKSDSSGEKQTQLIAPHLSELTLEPHTRTVFSEFFVAEPQHLYAAFFCMPSQFKTANGSPWFWDKRRIHYVGGRIDEKPQTA